MYKILNILFIITLIISSCIPRSIQGQEASTPPRSTIEIDTVQNLPPGWTHFILDQSGLTNNNITTIYEHKNGDVWFGTSKSGILVYNGNNFTQPLKELEYAQNYINDIMTDSKGSMWIAAKRLYRYDGNVWHIIPKKSLKGFKSVPVMFEDTKGNMWFGISGLFQFDGEKSTAQRMPFGAPLWIKKIIEDDNQRIWVSMGSDKTSRVANFNGKKWILHKPKNGAPNKTITTLIKDLDGNVWTGEGYEFGNKSLSGNIVGDLRGGGGGSIKRYDGENWESFFVDQDSIALNKLKINAGLVDKIGKVWFVAGIWDAFAFGGGVYCFNGTDWTIFNKDNGLSAGAVNLIFEDRNGEIWIAGSVEKNDGHTIISRFNHNNWIDELRIGKRTTFNIIFEDMAGNMWFGTEADGLYKYSPTTK